MLELKLESQLEKEREQHSRGSTAGGTDFSVGRAHQNPFSAGNQLLPKTTLKTTPKFKIATISLAHDSTKQFSWSHSRVCGQPGSAWAGHRSGVASFMCLAVTWLAAGATQPLILQ